MLYWGIILFICIIVFVVLFKALNNSCWYWGNGSICYCIGNAFKYLQV